MELADGSHLRYCSFCGRKVVEPVLYEGYAFCSARCKESHISSNEKARGFRKLQSIRSFTDEAIPENVLRRILEAGRNTPTSHNIQPWHFIVISHQEIKEELAVTGKFVRDAPLLIVGCGDPADSPKWYELEVAIALQSMVLTAWMQGIGSCWVDVKTNEDRVRGVLGIPDRLKLVAGVAFGYPAEIPKPTWKKPLEHITHYNTFNRGKVLDRAGEAS